MGRFRKSSLLGAAAVPLVVLAGAAAAQPVEYVRVCDAYGSGYFYIPGTETCLRISGYVNPFIHTGGSDITIRALAYEPTLNVLVNPFDSVDVDLEGRGVSFGARGMFAGRLDGFGFGIEGHYNEIEGRGVSGGFVPNVGIPGVGEDFGVFQNRPTDYSSFASVDMQQWGVKVEGNYRLFRGGQLDASEWRFNVKALAGLHVARTDSELAYGARLDNDFGRTDVRYFTELDETSLTPYVGLSAGAMRRFDDYTLKVGLSGRIGSSFTCYSGDDTLAAWGASSLSQQINIDENSTNLYASLNGSIGVSRGPVSISLTGGADYGAYRDPKIFRADSVEVPGGGFETVPTRLDPEPIWTGKVGVRVSYKFGGSFAPQSGF